jgi:hypothetical protein
MIIYMVEVFVVLTCSGISSVWSCSNTATVSETEYMSTFNLSENIQNERSK